MSVASVAVGDFARQVFERFDDKETLVIGAGEMAEETLRYVQDAGARRVVVVNRHLDRATELALRWGGRARPWDELPEALAAADLVVSATGATDPIVTREGFAEVERLRQGRPLVVLDLARFPTYICIRSTTFRRRAGGIRRRATRNCPQP